MEQLIEILKKAMADSVSFSMKTQQFHWNVEGENFYQLHLLFQRIYEEVNGSIDMFGEQIRALDSYAPFSPIRISELSSIQDFGPAPIDNAMIRQLFTDNAIVMETLRETYQLAERFNELGLSNFIQDRLTAHSTHKYLLRSAMKGME